MEQQQELWDADAKDVATVWENVLNEIVWGDLRPEDNSDLDAADVVAELCRAQAEPRRHKTKRAARARPSSIMAGPRPLKVELLRASNHHQRKSNQKEKKKRGRAPSFSHRAVRLVAQPSGPSGYRHPAAVCPRRAAKLPRRRRAT